MLDIMNKKMLVISTFIALVFVIFCVHIYQAKVQADEASQVIVDVSSLCSANKVIIDGQEFHLKIDREIKLTKELRTRYGADETPDKGLLLLETSITDKYENVVYKQENPWIINYSKQKGQYKLDKKNTLLSINDRILIDDFYARHKEYSNSRSQAHISILTLKEGNVLKNITVKNLNNDIKTKYDVLTNKDGMLEVRSD